MGEFEKTPYTSGNETCSPHAERTPVLFLGEEERIFHFFSFLFLQMFLLLIPFVHFTVSSLFARYFVFVLLPRVLRICKSVFWSQAFFTLHPFWQLTQPSFIKVSLGPAVQLWMLQGFPLRFKTQTWPICLFESHSVWQMLLLDRFYLFVRGHYILLY